MNATSFLTNISRNLQSLETQIKSISTVATTSDESKIKLEEIQKSISDIKTLIQQQQNSFKQHSEMVEQHINQLKLNQNGILSKLNEVLFKIESSVNQNCTLTKSKQKKTINNLHGTSSESDDANNNKANPYDSAPTLVALIRSKIKENEQNDEDSDGSIEEEFMFDYSKHFTHKANRKILKSYVLFFMNEYESRGENFSKYRYC
ncbi:unnamed protein product [Rhizophagus irregularis]|nr:unnamed protein product [Rhizophagus irregularis]